MEATSSGKKRAIIQVESPNKKQSPEPNKPSSNDNDQSQPHDLPHIIVMHILEKDKKLRALLNDDQDLVEITGVLNRPLMAKGRLAQGHYTYSLGLNPGRDGDWQDFWWKVPLETVTPMSLETWLGQSSIFLGGVIVADLEDSVFALLNEHPDDCETGKAVTLRCCGWDFCELVVFIDGWPRSSWSQVDRELDGFAIGDLVVMNLHSQYPNATVTFLHVMFKYSAIEPLIRSLPR